MRKRVTSEKYKDLKLSSDFEQRIVRMGKEYRTEFVQLQESYIRAKINDPAHALAMERNVPALKSAKNK